MANGWKEDFYTKQNSEKFREFMTILEGRPGCSLCVKTFASVGSLTSHIEAVHLKQTIYNCQYCGQTFSSKSHRSVHIHRNHRAEHHERGRTREPGPAQIPPPHFLGFR